MAQVEEPLKETVDDASAGRQKRMQDLFAARDRTVPGSPEEERACMAIVEAMFGG